MTLTEKIKLKALELGFVKVGITTADDFDDYIDKLTSRKNYEFLIDKGEKSSIIMGSKPKSVAKEAKSIISIIYSYSHIDFPEKLIDKVGRAYQARCYIPKADNINGARLELFKEFLRKNNINPLIVPDLPERAVAARAGTITYGKNNFAYADGYGSFVILYSVPVDAELDYDKATLVSKCPEKCNLCIEACPTNAIYSPGKLDPHRCIGYNNWMAGKRGIDSDYFIPYDIRDKIGSRIHGCDICQSVCPRNTVPLKRAAVKDPFLEKTADEYDLEKILELNHEYYDAVIEPIMYNYIHDFKYFRRNAAIAMGNSRDEKYLPALRRAMENDGSYVKEYLAWAIGKIGGADAKAILEKSLDREDDPRVVNEIETALKNSDNIFETY